MAVKKLVTLLVPSQYFMKKTKTNTVGVCQLCSLKAELHLAVTVSFFVEDLKRLANHHRMEPGIAMALGNEQGFNIPKDRGAVFLANRG